MKKQFFGIIMIACFVLAVLTGCSKTSQASSAVSAGDSQSDTTEQASIAPEVSASPTVDQTAEPVESAGDTAAGELAIEGVEFDQAADDYFGGDAAAAIEKMSSLLLSAAMAEFSVEKPFYSNENPDTSFEWAMVYQYINSFGDENTKLEKQEDGSLVVPEDEMKEYFNSFFSFIDGTVPSVDTDFSIKYDENSKSYTVGRSDFGEIGFTVTGFSLSNTNSAADPTISATVVLTGKSMDDESAGNVLVEIIPKTDTMFGYSVQSVVME